MLILYIFAGLTDASVLFFELSSHSDNHNYIFRQYLVIVYSGQW